LFHSALGGLGQFSTAFASSSVSWIDLQWDSASRSVTFKGDPKTVELTALAEPNKVELTALALLSFKSWFKSEPLLTMPLLPVEVEFKEVEDELGAV
jgi:hypothetical protein